MSGEKKDFYGKEVTDAIKKACETLNVPQEMLDIEVLETGSNGIFGLIRRKAKIRVSLKQDVDEDFANAISSAKQPEPEETVEEQHAEESVADETQSADDAEPIAKAAIPVEEKSESAEIEVEAEAEAEAETEASAQSVAIVKAQLVQLLEKMGYPSEVAVSNEGLAVECNVSGEFEEELAGPEGKTLDSIQYLLRKMVARQCPERLRIKVNVGSFRERRLEELKQKAVEYAAKVKETGKTQVLPALNPSERREIHMVLQEDKEVRSRSVGDGLFKKILIYKPGKAGRGGRKKGGNRGGRKGRNGKNGAKPTSDE